VWNNGCAKDNLTPFSLQLNEEKRSLASNVLDVAAMARILHR
jgi:hypothetical protein